MGKVYVFFAEGFEEVEALGTVDILRRAGVDAVTVSTTEKEFVAGAHGVKVACDVMFSQQTFDDADMIVLPGGLPGATNLYDHEGLRKLIVRKNEEGIYLAAICAAPLVYGRLGLLEGKKATCYPGFEKELAGAETCGNDVERCGNVITGKGPGFTFKFALTLVEALKGRQVADEVAGGMLLGGKPILMRTVQRFYLFDSSADIILVLPAGHYDYWKELCDKYSFDIPHRVVSGGVTRFHSVKNGLAAAADEGLIAVHDGVRPFVSAELLERCFAVAEAKGSAIPAIPLSDSIRVIDGEHGSKAADRSRFRLVQTPQVFDAALLKHAYECGYSESFTDDASVVEAAGASISLAEGDVRNIKITTPFDLKVAEAML